MILDYSQLLLNHLLWVEVALLNKHGKDHSKQLMSRSKRGEKNPNLCLQENGSAPVPALHFQILKRMAVPTPYV